MLHGSGGEPLGETPRSPAAEVGQIQASASWAGGDPLSPWPASVPAAIVTFDQDLMFTPKAAEDGAPRLGATVFTVSNAAHGGLLTHPQPTIAAGLDAIANIGERS